MNFELFWVFKKLIHAGVYLFDFMIINHETLESNIVGYIIINTKTNKNSYVLPECLLNKAPNFDINTIIDKVIKNAKDFNKTVY